MWWVVWRGVYWIIWSGIRGIRINLGYSKFFTFCLVGKGSGEIKANMSQICQFHDAGEGL